MQPLPWRSIAWLLVALVASSALFLAFGTYSRTVEASGTVDPNGRIILSAPASTMAQIVEGQAVRLVPEASLSRDSGIFRGIVDHVATPSARDGSIYSQVTVRVEGQRMPVASLRPGQSLNAHIVIGQRSLFQWLASRSAAQP